MEFVTDKADFAHAINQMSDILEVWKYWSLKYGFRSIFQKF